LSPHSHRIVQWLKLVPLHPHWIVFFISNRLIVLERWLESRAVQVELSVLILVLHLVLHCCILLERMLLLGSLSWHEVLEMFLLVLMLRLV